MINDQKCILTPRSKDFRFWKSFLNATNKLKSLWKWCSFNNIWQKQLLFLTFFTTLIFKVFCLLKRCLIFVGSVNNFAQRIIDICFPLKSPFLLFQQKIQIFNWLYPSCTVLQAAFPRATIEKLTYLSNAKNTRSIVDVWPEVRKIDDLLGRKLIAHLSWLHSETHPLLPAPLVLYPATSVHTNSFHEFHYWLGKT